MFAPLTLNAYCYCVNDPLGYVDPSGLRIDWVKNVRNAVIGAGVTIIALITLPATGPVLVAGALIYGAIGGAAIAANSYYHDHRDDLGTWDNGDLRDDMIGGAFEGALTAALATIASPILRPPPGMEKIKFPMAPEGKGLPILEKLR